MTRQETFGSAPLGAPLTLSSRGSRSSAVDAGGRWLKLADAAHLLGVSEITLRRRVRQGTLRHEFRGGRYYVFVPEGADAASLLGEAPPHVEEARGTLPSRRAHASSGTVTQPLEGLAARDSGPSAEQIVAILSIEVREKEKEILELRRALTDQVTLNQALEAALAEALGIESSA